MHVAIVRASRAAHDALLVRARRARDAGRHGARGIVFVATRGGQAQAIQALPPSSLERGVLASCSEGRVLEASGIPAPVTAGSARLGATQTFAIPNVLPIASGVTQGATAPLTFATPASAVTCTYRGDTFASDGLALDGCSDGSRAGSLASASSLDLRVTSGNIRVRARISPCEAHAEACHTVLSDVACGL